MRQPVSGGARGRVLPGIFAALLRDVGGFLLSGKLFLLRMRCGLRGGQLLLLRRAFEG